MLNVRLALAPALALAALAATAGTALAAPYPDQSNSSLPTGNFVAIRTGTTASQTFVAGFPGTLGRVDVVVDSRGAPAADLVLSIQATVGGVPDGITLASASVAPFAPGNPTLQFDVSGAGLVVAAGDSLAFVMSSAAVLGNDYLMRAVPSNRYAHGQFTDSGGAFGSGAGWDAIFKTFVDPASLPGPGSSDQANLQTPTGNFAAIATGLTATQTFTVGTEGTLTRIEVVVDPRNSPVLDLLLEVQTTSGGAATGDIVALATVTAFGGSNPTVSFDVSPYNLSVSSGEVLAFVLRSNAAGGTDYLARAVPGNTYAGGEFTNSTGGFGSGAGWDAIFETFVDGGTTGVEIASAGTRGIVLEPARPNPVSIATDLSFAVPSAGPVTLTVHDVSGRLVRTLVDRTLSEGVHVVRWDRGSDAGRRAPAGVYFTRLVAGGAVRSGRVVVVR